MSSRSSSGRKKFGRNLNKQLAAPTPITPPPGISSTRSSSSRNGLLLLSTKRSSTSGGLLSKTKSSSVTNKTPAAKAPTRQQTPEKPKEEQSPSVQQQGPKTTTTTTTKAPSSTHEALLDAVNGTSASKTAEQQQPAAWGASEALVPDGEKPKDGETTPASDEIDASNWRKSERSSVDQVEYTSRMNQERGERQSHDDARERWDEARGNELQDKMHASAMEQRGPPTTRTLFDPNAGTEETTSNMNGSHAAAAESSPVLTATPDSMPDGPVIHLNSYEDRDRGERSSGTAPRMLFDPKSGSMVAVKAEKGGRKGKAALKSSSRGVDDGDNENDRPARRGKPPRKDSEVPRRDRRRGDSIDSPTAKDAASMSTATRGGKVRPAETRLPRTRGVLYVRDGKGNCYCADGCEGDQGYGSHGVPGGRIRNPVAHAKFIEEQQQQLAYANDYDGEDYGYDGQGEYGSSSPAAQVAAAPVEFVKGDDKIELLTGAPESPTLQATARPWAPTGGAALAAPAPVASTPEKEPATKIDESTAPTSTDEDIDDNDPNHFIGLGFDPTANMDSVMQSPANKTAKTRNLEGVDFSSLSLNAAPPEPAANIFAFGTDTWASSGNNGARSTWANSGNAAGSSWLGTTTEAEDDGKTAEGTNSFLSLSTTNNTWGGLPGLAGGRLPNGGGGSLPNGGGGAGAD